MSLVQLCPKVAVDPKHVVAVSYLRGIVELRLDTGDTVSIDVYPRPETADEYNKIVPAILSKLNQKGEEYGSAC